MPQTITVTMADQLGLENPTAYYSAWLTSDAKGQVTVKSELNVPSIVQFLAMDDGTYYLWVTAKNRDRVPIAGQAVVVAGSAVEVAVVMRYYPYNASWGAALADLGADNSIRNHVSWIYHKNESGLNLIAGPMNAEGDQANQGVIVYAPTVWKNIGQNPNIMIHQAIYTIAATSTPIVRVDQVTATPLT